MVQCSFVIIWKKNTAAVMPGHLPLLDRANKIRKDSCMKNFHSRLAAAILSAALLVTVLPAGVLAEEPEQLPAANAAPDCTCTVSCTEEAKNAECAVCGADGAALEACAANAADMQTEEDALVQEDEITLLDVQDGVAYVDETGADQTHDGVTAVTAEDTAWESGWYIAQGEITIDNRVAVNGTVVLILADDCDLTVNGGIDVSAGNSFTVYGQEGGSGSLTAAGSTYNSNSGDAGIGGNTDAVDFGDITLAATGTIEATGGYRAAGIGGGGKVNNQVLTTGNITICSGVVKADGGAFAAGIGNGADGIGNSALSLTLDGENSLLFSDSYTEAGIQIMWESSLEIDGDGALTIGTPDMAPRVGIGTEMEGFDQITLLGGKVTVYGRYVGVGVGDAWYGGEEKSAVIISGGSLYAEIAEDDPRGAAIGGRPMNEWMEAVCGVQITGGTVVAGNGGICGDVTVTGGSVAGVIESLTNARVPARITAPIGAAVEALTLRNAAGAAAAYGCPAVVPDSGELTLYLPSGTYSGAMLVDGQLKTFTGLTASGDIQSAVSLTDTGVRVDLPDGTQVPLETDGADMVLPDGSAIQTGSGPVITIDEDAAVSPEGEITLPGGGSATVNDGTGNGITVTAPPAGGTIVPGADGSVMLPGGSTVQTGDQTVTIPDGGGLLQPDGELRYTVTVTFDSRGGSAVSTQEITAGSLLTQPEQPVRSGYRFTGWYQDAACTVAWDFDAMPVTEDLTLYAGWKKTSSGGSSGGSGSSAGNSGSEKEPSGGQAAQDHPFEDVAEGTYYHDAVLWAVENGITAGVTETLFAPGQACTRAQMVTFLWRAAGSPAPTATENPFTDVAESAYYHDAVLWAAENGITGGTSAGTFSPNATVTRAQTVTFLYRAAGAPAVSGGSFADVEADAYYADAVVWAAEQGITSGTTAETFSPAQACTRAQIVTFLYRDRA